MSSNTANKATSSPSNTSTAVKAGADDARSYWLDEGRAAGGYIRQVDYAANS
jgi:hypothetical protein